MRPSPRNGESSGSHSFDVGMEEGSMIIRTSSWRAFVAGLCAGPSLLFLGRDIPHNSLAMYVLARSVTLFVRCGNRMERGRLLYWLLSPTRMKRGDVLLMCMAGMQILYSYIMTPHILPKSYRHFLSRHVGQEPHVIQALQVQFSAK